MRKWKKTDPTARPGHGARLTPVQIMRFYLRGQGGGTLGSDHGK